MPRAGGSPIYCPREHRRNTDLLRAKNNIQLAKEEMFSISLSAFSSGLGWLGLSGGSGLCAGRN
jgi:hypothetical protein